MFEHYGSATPYLYSGIDLCDEIEKELLREYCVNQCSSGVDEDNDRCVTIGGFIVCKEKLKEYNTDHETPDDTGGDSGDTGDDTNPSRIMSKAFGMWTSPI